MLVNWFAYDCLLWCLLYAYWFYSWRSTNANKSSESTKENLRHLIPTAMGFYLIFSTPRPMGILGIQLYPKYSLTEIFGFLVTLTGLSLAAWARMHLGRYWSAVVTLKEDHRLIRSGPYRFVRHPIYTGLIGGLCGTALIQGNFSSLLGLALVICAFVIKYKKEEKLLSLEFGEEYAKFKEEVPALFPYK